MQPKPSKNFEELLNLLYELDKVKTEEFPLGIELFSGDLKYKPYNYLNDKSWFQNDLTPYFDDQFIEFAGRDGEVYCLWYYPNLVGEPPVIFRGGDGDNCTIAPSMKDFICLLVSGLESTPYEPKPEYIWGDEEEFKSHLEYLKDEVPKKYNDILKLQKIASKIIDCSDYKTIIQNFKQHPKFHKWVEKVEKKDEELNKKN